MTWEVLIILLLSALLPVAVWFGIQVGQEREAREWEKSFEDPRLDG